MSIDGPENPGRLIVSLHDVAPPFEREIREQLHALAGVGVSRQVLNVVPNWHASTPLPSAASFTDLLRTQSVNGSELALHGCQHTSDEKLRGPVPLRVRAALFAPDASEFVRLTPRQAGRGVAQGLNLFAQADLPRPSSFCAPGWLLAPDLYPVLRAAGLTRVIGMYSVRDLRSGRCVIPATGHMGASRLHEGGIRLANGIVRRVLPRSTVVALYLHPQGGARSAAAQRVLAEAERLIALGWEPATYQDVMPVTGEPWRDHDDNRVGRDSGA